MTEKNAPCKRIAGYNIQLKFQELKHLYKECQECWEDYRLSRIAMDKKDGDLCTDHFMEAIYSTEKYIVGNQYFVKDFKDYLSKEWINENLSSEQKVLAEKVLDAFPPFHLDPIPGGFLRYAFLGNDLIKKDMFMRYIILHIDTIFAWLKLLELIIIPIFQENSSKQEGKL